MPFDQAGFPERPRPERPPISDNAATAIILIVAVCLLVMPISLAAFTDVVRYMRGN